MANNDSCLIDGIIDDIIIQQNLEDNEKNRGIVFETFAIGQILKAYDLSNEQLKDGLVDGGDDGGIDGLYIFINGIYLLDKAIQIWPKSNAELEIYVITCKHHCTFELSPLESVDSSLSELFNLNLGTEKLKSKYKKEIIEKRENLIYAYRKLASVLSRCSINTIYVSRGDSEKVAENIQKKGEKIQETYRELFLQCETSMKFWGAKELIKEHRKKRNGKTALYTQKVFQLSSNFVILTTLENYYKFIIDDLGKLKRYYFEENVRDFLGENRTNVDIARTLNTNDSPDFWLLNNGITILVSSAVSFDGQVEVENVQIVNGLQTTNTIYQYFSDGGKDDKNRCVLVKIIVSTDELIRNQIIQATNNQSSIPLYSLHATDKIQKDIEDVLLKNNLYYERKDKYYKNLGYSQEDIFTPLYLASGCIALILKLPHRAALIKSKFMNYPKQYEHVFSGRNLYIWPKIAIVLRKTDRVAEKYRPNINTSTEKYLKTVRPIISLVAVASMLGKYSFGEKDLLNIDTGCLLDEVIEKVTQDVVAYINKSKSRSIKNIAKRTSINAILIEMAMKYNIDGFAEIEKRKDFIYDDYEIDDEFLLIVRDKLSSQHWHDGIHRNIAEELGCAPSKAYRAIDKLIKTGNLKTI